MQIYNNKNLTSSHHILDPDYKYNTTEDMRGLYSFFKDLSLPNDTTILISLYLSIQIVPFPYEQYPYIYQKFLPRIQETIRENLDFDNSMLYHLHHNNYYAVIVDRCENDITQDLFNLHQILSHKTFEYLNHQCHIQLKCGIYFSHIYIDPFEFYQCAKEQHNNTLQDPKTILSIKNSLYDDVVLSQSAYNNNK